MGGIDLWASFESQGVAVMAIVNVTPDSFYSASRTATREALEKRIEECLAQGAAIIDVGGYSSRPGAPPVDPQTELERICVAMDVIRERFPRAIVSLDTFRARVAREVIGTYGPCIVNDISAGEIDARMIQTVADLGVPYVAMHMRGTPDTMHKYSGYTDIATEIEGYFRAKLESLAGYGIERVAIDPGFGFAKTLEQNYEVFRALPRLAALGVPLLVGISRKSMIYKVTGGGSEDALAGTAALHWKAIESGAKVLRAHDVKAACDVVKLYEYYNESGRAAENI